MFKQQLLIIELESNVAHDAITTHMQFKLK